MDVCECERETEEILVCVCVTFLRNLYFLTDDLFLNFLAFLLFFPGMQMFKVLVHPKASEVFR
jgi:hypothetical protein